MYYNYIELEIHEQKHTIKSILLMNVASGCACLRGKQIALPLNQRFNSGA
ncbi:UNVERIFIED_CONTAM: hypothetical protein Cloal_1546 [Acetivibrio alkalicellulosi]